MPIQTLDKGWKLLYDGGEIPASVPGDIHIDLFKAGKIDDPYFGLNHKNLKWIVGSDFCYELAFDVAPGVFSSEEILLELDGVDTFSEVYLNGQFILKTENMFLKYSQNVKQYLKKSGNILKVNMFSTTKRMESINTDGYFGVFNVERLFIRKAQCHFGWDWAPDLPGYGICGGVRLAGVRKNRIHTVNYRAYPDGTVAMFAELNYSVRPYMDFNGNVLKESNPECKNDKLRFIVAKSPRHGLAGDCLEQTIKVEGRKNFCNFKVDEAELWWPAGYGEQPLYEYKVELIRSGKVVDERSGRLAFREVQLVEKPVGDKLMSYAFKINGEPVFVKGANWVPAECFIGCITDDKYRDLISRAVDGNLNMLRVWGGGLYEKDIFYDLCDEKGIMVWQDMMFACADIPEDDVAFVENVKKEITYQIERLRVHPSIVYWCGGNEKTGTYGLVISHGDYFVDVILRGLILNLDNTRPYARQSPCALTDIGNDMTSGESHANSFEAMLQSGADGYRKNIASKVVPFVSECALMGPCSLQGYKKMFPEDKLWPMNEYWDDRLMDNPYAAILMPFAKRQLFYAENFYGKCQSIQSFIAKGMTVHAEALRAECEHARANKGHCWGFMNWMYSDIWPSASCASVDYFGEPKQVYYQSKRSYAPVLLTFVQNANGVVELVLVNDGLTPVDTCVEYGLKTLKGEVLWKKLFGCNVKANGVARDIVDLDYRGKNLYLFATCEVGGETLSCVYSYDFWRSCSFASHYSYAVEKTEGGLRVTFTAKEFAKGITLSLPDNHMCRYTDNYFDLEAGQVKTVFVKCSGDVDEHNLQVTDFSKETRI